MLKEFKEFALKGNVIDLAVGVIIGGAFGKLHHLTGQRLDYATDWTAARQSGLFQSVHHLRRRRICHTRCC